VSRIIGQLEFDTWTFSDSVRFRQPTSIDIEMRLAERSIRGKTPAPSTLDYEVKLPERILNYSVECRVIAINPIATARLVRKSNVRTSVIAEEIFKRLSDGCEAALKPILTVAFDTGMRKRASVGPSAEAITSQLLTSSGDCTIDEATLPNAVFLGGGDMRCGWLAVGVAIFLLARRSGEAQRCTPEPLGVDPVNGNFTPTTWTQGSLSWVNNAVGATLVGVWANTDFDMWFVGYTGIESSQEIRPLRCTSTVSRCSPWLPKRAG